MQISNKLQEMIFAAFDANAVLCSVCDRQALLDDPEFEVRTYASGQVVFSPNDYQKAFGKTRDGLI